MTVSGLDLDPCGATLKDSLNKTRLAARMALMLMATGLMAGCALGPDFVRPVAPEGAGFKVGAALDKTVSAPAALGGEQHFDAGRDIPADWWRMFGSPWLNSLVEKALKANPGLEAAQAALRQAQQNTLAQQGYFYPTVGLDYNAQHTKIAGNLAGNSAPGLQGNGNNIGVLNPPPTAPVYYGFHTAQLNLSYAPDVFGGNRRQVESLRAQEEAQNYQLQAAIITLAANVVAAALQEASVHAQMVAMEKMVEAQRERQQIVNAQLNLGYASGIDQANQDAALAQAQQGLEALRLQWEQTRDLLRALVGGLPNQDLGAGINLVDLKLPQDLPLGVPSKLVEQRPDVRAAEALLHSANAQIGVAVANRFPQFNITGAFGGAAQTPDQLAHMGAGFFSLLGDVSMPIFAGGTLEARESSAREGVAMAAAQYRSTVLMAFQNVADTLHAVESDARSLEMASRNEAAARQNLVILEKQYEVGYAAYPDLLSARAVYQQAQITLAQAQVNRLGDTAALYVALGGGWWNNTSETASTNHKPDQNP
jgi:NodT family efflux transporter outer membrane factor (OMF) lipoprotein